MAVRTEHFWSYFWLILQKAHENNEDTRLIEQLHHLWVGNCPGLVSSSSWQCFFWQRPLPRCTPSQTVPPIHPQNRSRGKIVYQHLIRPVKRKKAACLCAVTMKPPIAVPVLLFQVPVQAALSEQPLPALRVCRSFSFARGGNRKWQQTSRLI